MTLFLLIISLAAGPQFILPMADASVCLANAAEMSALIDHKSGASVGCWDMTRQAFVAVQPPQPSGEKE